MLLPLVRVDIAKMGLPRIHGRPSIVFLDSL